jgi:fibro-slime domain-containing protein
MARFPCSPCGCSDVGLPLPFDGRKDDETGFTLQAKVRDFKEGNPTDNAGTHPHFNHIRWICDAPAMGATVEPALATDGAPDPGFPGDSRTPRLAAGMSPELARCFEPADRFPDWYEDRGDDVNRPFLVDLKFERGGDGRFRFRNDFFFPLDDGAAFRKAGASSPDPFGHLQTGMKDDVDLSQHNYGFTMELHAQFRHAQGKGHAISARGDDDLWIFVDGRLVLDLGGTHPAQQASVDLDGLGLADGQVYAVDVFFAERSVASSNLTLETNVRLSPIE